MGLVFTDGCDSYGATSDLSRIWAGSVGAQWSYAAGAGRLGGGALQGGSGAVSALQSLIAGWSFAAGTKMGASFWLKISASPAAISQLFADGTASTAGIGTGAMNCISVQTSGKLSGYDNNNLRYTGSINVCDNQWHWIEWQNPASGSVAASLYVDRILQGSSITGQAVARSQVQFCSIAGVTTTIDDFIYYNDTAPGLVSANFPIGPQVITAVRPTSDQSIQFTPDSGSTNYTQVDEAVPDGDSSYVSGQTSGQTDLYGYGSIGFVPVAINGVMVTTVARNPGSGQISFKNRCSSGGTVSDSAAIGASTSPTYAAARTAYDQDPHTSAAWIKAGLDAAQFGFTVP